MPADAGPAASDTAASDSEDSVISAERAHLVRSREFLHLMRENVLELAKNPMAGARVSLEYLKADLYRRAEALKDLPDAPLFFGRLDYVPGAAAGESLDDFFSVGDMRSSPPAGWKVKLIPVGLFYSLGVNGQRLPTGGHENGAATACLELLLAPQAPRTQRYSCSVCA